MGQRQVWSKLPDWLQMKWRSQGHKFSQENAGSVPPFTSLIHFIEYTAGEISDPNFEKLFEPKNNRTLRTADVDSTDQEKFPSECIYHKKEGHTLVNCRVFNNLKYQEKQRFAIDNKLCFRCLGGHMVRECSSDAACAKCRGNHVTLMHRDKGIYNDSSKSRCLENEDTDRKTLCSVVCGNPLKTLSCSKTVLCEIHHEKNPQNAIKLYAICLLYTSPSPRDKRQSRMPSSA